MKSWARRFPVRVILAAISIIEGGVSSSAPLHDWDLQEGGRDWEGACSGSMQSPINIAPGLAVESTSTVKLLFQRWKRNDTVRNDQAAAHFGLDFLENADGGFIQVGPAYDDIDEYFVRSIRVHMPSEHLIMGKRFPVEVQMWHELSVPKRLDSLRRKASDLEATLEALKEKEEKLTSRAERLKEFHRGVIDFPDDKTESDWVAAGKKEIEEATSAVHVESKAVFERLSEIEIQAYQLLRNQKRPLASRRVAISVFFRHMPAVPLSLMMEHPEESDSSKFIRWLAHEVHDDDQGNSSEAGMSPNGKGMSPLFDVRTLLYEGAKDTLPRTDSLSKGYHYEGSITRPPCTPDVRWFLSAEPLIASTEDLDVLWNAGTLVKRNALTYSDYFKNESGPWEARTDVKGSSRHIVPLGDRTLSWVLFNTIPFQKPLTRLTSTEMENLQWFWINLYCLVFLLSSVLMIVVMLMMCAKCACRDVPDADNE